MSNEFIHAFNHAMIYEVGPFWNPSDPDVIAGKIDTKEQRKKVGYVNIPADKGGETKYGIAQKMNPNVNVRQLNLAQAMAIYEQNYWVRGLNNCLSYPLSIMHFDGCVNIGVGRASKFLQQAIGVEADGKIGPITLAKIQSIDQKILITNLSKTRSNFYYNIVKNDPPQKIFLNGWIRRITEVTDFTISKL